MKILMGFLAMLIGIGVLAEDLRFSDLCERDKAVVVESMMSCLTNLDFGCGVVSPLALRQQLCSIGEMGFDERVVGEMLLLGLDLSRFQACYVDVRSTMTNSRSSACFFYLNGDKELLTQTNRLSEGRRVLREASYNPRICRTGEYILCLYCQKSKPAFIPWTYAGSYATSSNKYEKAISEIPAFAYAWENYCYVIPKYCALVVRDAEPEEDVPPSWSRMRRRLIENDRENVKNWNMMCPVLHVSSTEATEFVYCVLLSRGRTMTINEFNCSMIEPHDKFLCRLSDDWPVTEFGKRMVSECQKRGLVNAKQKVFP